MKTTPKPSQIAMLAGGAVAFLFSFFAFVDYAYNDDSAWSSNAFPLATWPALLGLVVGGSVALALFAGTKLPEPILTFNWDQIRFICSFAALLVMLGWLVILDNKGIGFWFMLLGTLAYTAGAVMELLGIEVPTSAGGAPGPNEPPTPF